MGTITDILSGDFRSAIDQDSDDNVIDNVAGGVAGVGNVVWDRLTGSGPEGDTWTERMSNTPGYIADTYNRGSAAGNQLGDDVASWWDSL